MLALNMELEKQIYSLLGEYTLDISDVEEIIELINENRISIEAIEFYLEKKYNDMPSEFKKQLEVLFKKLFNRCKELSTETILGNKTISVIITTYNRKNMLMEAIDSILQQTYNNYEIIIIDDNSSDGTEELLKNKYYDNTNIIYYNTRINQGPGKNRLLGYKKFAKGELIIFMDDDDFFLDKDYFTKCVNLHSSDNNIAFVAADSFIYYENSGVVNFSQLNIPMHIANNEYLYNFQTENYPKPNSTFTSMFNRKILDKVELSNMEMVNDSSIYLRSLIGGNPIFLNHIVGVYRMHGKNITFSCSCDFIIGNLKEKYEIKKILEKSIEVSEFNIEKWYSKQLDITIIYYLSNSPVKVCDYYKLLIWLKNNATIYYKNNVFRLSKKFLKAKIKNCFKRVKERIDI